MTPEIEKLFSDVNKFVHPPKERTLFSLGGRGYYENPASDVLAFFLDPYAEHGFKTLFLDAFLECIGVSSEELGFAGVTVSREVDTGDGGRIDLLIKSGDWVLLIENKIYHIQVNPFASYEKYARKLIDGRKPLMAILSPEGKSVHESWDPVSYKAFCASLRRRLSDALIDHNYSKWVVFAREFILHFENELYKPAMNEEQAAFVEQNTVQIEKVKQLASEYRGYLLRLLKSSLEAAVTNHVFWTTDDTWAVRCRADKWGRSNIAFLSEASESGRRFLLTVYLIDLSTEQLAQARRDFQETNRMKVWTEGKWMAWQTQPGFDSREAAVTELCRLGRMLAELFKSPPEAGQPAPSVTLG